MIQVQFFSAEGNGSVFSFTHAMGGADSAVRIASDSELPTPSMLFTGFPFTVFVLITLLLYYTPPLRSWQVPVLAVASFIFYAWETPFLVFLLLFSIAINVVTSYYISRGNPLYQRVWAIAGVLLNLGALLFFKYSPMFARTFFGGDHGSLGHFLMTIPLPIGISFFTDFYGKKRECSSGINHSTSVP